MSENLLDSSLQTSPQPSPPSPPVEGGGNPSEELKVDPAGVENILQYQDGDGQNLNVLFFSDLHQLQAPPSQILPPPPSKKSSRKRPRPPPQLPSSSSYVYVTSSASIENPGPWRYYTGAQIAAAIAYRSVTPTMRQVLADNPCIELLESVNIEQKNRPRQFTAHCHACIKTLQQATADSVSRHVKSAKHLERFQISLQKPDGDSMEEAIRLQNLRKLVERYPDFGLVDQRDMHQNEIFEWDLPPEERSIALNDLFCKVCRRKLASLPKLYKKNMRKHLASNAHKKKVAAEVERIASGRPPPKPTKISTRILNKDGQEGRDEDEEEKSQKSKKLKTLKKKLATPVVKKRLPIKKNEPATAEKQNVIPVQNTYSTITNGISQL